MNYRGYRGQHEEQVSPLVEQERLHRDLLEDDKGDTRYQGRFKKDISRDARCLQESNLVETDKD